MALVSVKEAARELGVSTSTLYALVKLGKIPHNRFGDRVLLSLDRVRAATQFEPEREEARPNVVRQRRA